MDKRVDLSTFDGITSALGELLDDLRLANIDTTDLDVDNLEPRKLDVIIDARIRAQTEKTKVSALLIEQARQALGDKAKHQGVLDAMTGKPAGGGDGKKSDRTGTPYLLRHQG
jgi:hypothetical protein